MAEIDPRTLGRAERLVQAATALRARIDRTPDGDPVKAQLEARLGEYEESIDNIGQGLPERPKKPDERIAVNIAVPTHVFKKKQHP